MLSAAELKKHQDAVLADPAADYEASEDSETQAAQEAEEAANLEAPTQRTKKGDKQEYYISRIYYSERSGFGLLTLHVLTTL